MATKPNTEAAATALATRTEEKAETAAEKLAREKLEDEAKELLRVESESKVNAAFEAASKMLAEARKMKADDFDEVEDDFFKFENKGDTIQGVYLGVISERIKGHCIGSVDKAGNAMMVRVNGTRQLTSTLERLAPLSDGKPRYYVRIEYTGSEKTGNGRMVKNFKIGTKPIAAIAK